MKKERLLELAGVQLDEGYEEDSLIWISVKDRKILKSIIGHWIHTVDEAGDDEGIEAEFALAKKLIKRL